MRLTCCLLRRAPVRRNREKNWNNAWYLNRELLPQETGDKATLEAMGIPVFTPEQIIKTPHLKPYSLPPDYRPNEDPLILGPILKKEDHPNYKETPVYSFNQRSFFPMGYEIKVAQNFTKTVQIGKGLPERIYDSISDVSKETNKDLQEIIKEALMFDATQKKLPKNFIVPYIGWHPVNDRMTARVPYDVNMSWQRKLPIQFGIPAYRKTLNLIRGLFRICDRAIVDRPSLLFRSQFESKVFRQYFCRSGKNSRIALEVPFSTSSSEPVEAYAVPQDAPLPDIYPMESHVGVWPTHVYREENNFPLLNMNCSSPHLHTIVDTYTSPIPNSRSSEGYAGRSIVLGFGAALGQARLRFGDDILGKILPSPVVIHVISTDGQKFHFGVFQLNTLNLNDDEGIKNFYWHESEMSSLYSVCSYVDGKPAFEDFNLDIYKKIKAIYLQGAN